MAFDPSIATEPYCYLTTRGRVSGEPREIEIWFALEQGVLFLMAGGRERSHWVRNLQREPAVSVRIRGVTYAARARVVAPGTPEDARPRVLLHDKYQPTYDKSLRTWADTSLPVAIEVAEG